MIIYTFIQFRLNQLWIVIWNFSNFEDFFFAINRVISVVNHRKKKWMERHCFRSETGAVEWRETSCGTLLIPKEEQLFAQWRRTRHTQPEWGGRLKNRLDDTLIGHDSLEKSICTWGNTILWICLKTLKYTVSSRIKLTNVVQERLFIKSSKK